jgi:sporulation protein YlmC with PRC-barrel domain
MKKKYLSKDIIVGKEVVDPNATIIGKVKDFAIDLSSRDIALTIETKSGVDLSVSAEDISIVGDVILLSKTVKVPPTPEVKKVSAVETPQKAPQTPTTPGLCASCGYQNDKTSNFCIKCGQKIS